MPAPCQPSAPRPVSIFVRSIALTQTQTSGQNYTLSASVTPSSATGTVEFFDGSTSLGKTALAAATATLSNVTLSAGSHTLSANYSGDSATAKSTGSSTVTVQASTTVTLASGANPDL